MSNTTRIKVTMDKAMIEALQVIAEKQEVTVSELIRQQMDVFLKAQGVELETNVQWGGRRDVPEEGG